MKIKVVVAAVMAILVSLVIGNSLIRAQTLTQPQAQALVNQLQSLQAADDLSTMVQAVETTTPVPASSLPLGGRVGTFYSAQFPSWPPLPGNLNQLPVWNLGDSIYLLSDEDFDYNPPVVFAPQMATSKSGGVGMMTMDASIPPVPGGGSGTNSFSSNGSPSPVVNYGTNLWIAQFNMATNTLLGIASNTLSGVTYEVQTNSNLATTNWGTMGYILGSELTNWTPLDAVSGNLTNNLFFRLRSDLSSDGSGLPNWWEQQYGITNADPNAQDLAGDGWSIYQKFAMRLNPNVFYPPPVPQGVIVNYNANTATATISWLPSPGPVVNYAVQRLYQSYVAPHQTNIFTVSTPSLTDNVSGFGPDPWQNENIPITYSVKANYTNGSSAWSTAIPLQTASFAGTINAGPQGAPELTVLAMPAGANTIQLTEIDEDAINELNYPVVIATNLTIPVNELTNGSVFLPNIQTTNGTCYWIGQAVGTNGILTANVNVADDIFMNPINGYPTNWMVPPFLDGRIQMKQNLIFELRAATLDNSFHFYVPAIYTTYNVEPGDYSYPTNYAYSGLFEFANQVAGNSYSNTVTDDPSLPYEENYLFRNFVYGPPDSDANGNLTTGALLNTPYYEVDYVGLESPKYQFSIDLTNFPAVLPTNSTRWLFYDQSSGNEDDPVSIGLVNISTDDQTYYLVSVTNDYVNWFGLPYISANLAYSDGTGLATNVIRAGSSANDFNLYQANIYPETAQPVFQKMEYDFWKPVREWDQSTGSHWQADILPGDPAFSPTNTSSLLITAVGDVQYQVAGYAKLLVSNSIYRGVYGYLGQYFSQAYQVGTNGTVTTNTTGILSPYGNFVATQPGQAALVTMPDPDTGAQGTCTVYAVSLNVDKNHDGTMNTSFNGPDATSQSSPFVFWCNNNYDRWALDDDDNTNYMDDVPPQGCPAAPNTPTPDCNYSNRLANGYCYRAIPCTRDLEDYARLWVCGLTTNLLATLPAGSTITLNWGDVGSPNSSNPTIDLFAAADTNGGIGYLTNETVAAQQTNAISSPYIGRLGPGQSIQLNAIQFANGFAGNYFIWCGVSNGTGGLSLTIQNGDGNVIAQSTAYIQIMDIKQMYERWTVGENLTNAPLSTPELASDDGLPAGAPAFQYPSPQNTNTSYILYVHGWNMDTYDKDRFAETAFKRLYWRGYQGRFGVFRWPTGSGFTGLSTVATNLTEKDNYDSSEFNAWQSGQGLLNKLSALNGEYPGHVYLLAHSMGNVVAGEALRLAGTNQVVNTYVASQAAVSAHTYDTNIPDYSFSYFPYSSVPVTPNIYGNWFAGNNSHGAKQIISFFNVNDFALNRAAWQLNQLFKPDQHVLENGVHWSYGYDGETNDPPPWNDFFKEDVSTTVDLNIVGSLMNRYEAMSYAAQSYTTALGATLGVANIEGDADLGRVSNPIWPPDPTGNDYTEHFWHSAQFRGDNALMQGYWIELLSSEGFGL